MRSLRCLTFCSHGSIRFTVVPRTVVNDRLVAVGMVSGGISFLNVARQFRVERHTVARWFQRHQRSNNVQDLPRSGRPRITISRQDRYIRVQHLRNRFQAATVTARTLPGHKLISSRVIRNRLREHSICPHRPAIRSVLQPRHRVARLAWCKQHQRRNLEQWSRVLFSDESHFSLFHHDGR